MTVLDCVSHLIAEVEERISTVRAAAVPVEHTEGVCRLAAKVALVVVGSSIVNGDLDSVIVAPPLWCPWGSRDGVGLAFMASSTCAVGSDE